jgi:hypothetical protein
MHHQLLPPLSQITSALSSPIILFTACTHPQQRTTTNMKLSAAITLCLAAAASANPFRPASKANPKASYMNKLVKSAKATRRLDQEMDLTAYSVKFSQCQFVKTYNDELADDEDSTTVLATQRFVIFRLCPVDSCSTCDTGFGEYVIDLDTYLQATVEYQQDLQESMCEACDECAQEAEAAEGEDEAAEDGGRRRLAVDCSTCYDECQKIENMEENGYVDATNFLECAMIYDPEDDGKSALYAGPTCASYGTKIKIGVFIDENCNTIDASKDVEDYLKDGDGYQMKLSHALLKTTYAEDSCMSCIDVDDNDADGNAAETNELCQGLYEEAAKCEDSHGFTGGYNMYANNNNNNNNNQKNAWYNQEAQEELVCEFISSLQSGTYDETGEIILSGGSSVVGGGSKTTGGQKFALTFFILGTVGLAV